MAGGIGPKHFEKMLYNDQAVLARIYPPQAAGARVAAVSVQVLDKPVGLCNSCSADRHAGGAGCLRPS